MVSSEPVKGSADGLEALRIAREKFPDWKVVLFGTGRRKPWIPSWAEYYRNPPQDFIVNQIYNGSRILLSSSWSEGFAFSSGRSRVLWMRGCGNQPLAE